MKKRNEMTLAVKRGEYIIKAIESISMSGDTYTYEDELYRVCKEKNQDLVWDVFRGDMRHLVSKNDLYFDGRRIYTRLTWDYQTEVVTQLADMLSCNELPPVDLPDPLMAEGITLTQEQRQAVAVALSHRISVILGGAGTGKSTLVTALSLFRPKEGSGILCAPTGKAARNLTSRTKRMACTVHGALGMRPEENFLVPILWESTELVVVDEASMIQFYSRSLDRCRVC